MKIAHYGIGTLYILARQIARRNMPFCNIRMRGAGVRVAFGRGAH